MLNGYRIHLRPLRERREEIGPIASSILDRTFGLTISTAAVRLLEGLDWPGNVRELEMLLRRVASEVPKGGMLDAGRLQLVLAAEPSAPVSGALRQQRIEGERRALTEALRVHSGNVSAAARSLGMSRQALYKALQRTRVAPRA